MKKTGIAKSSQDISNNSFSKVQLAAMRSNVVLEQSSRDVGCFLFPYNSAEAPFVANMNLRAPEMRGDDDENQSEYVTVEKPSMRIRREPADIFDEQSSYMVISAGAISRQTF